MKPENKIWQMKAFPLFTLMGWAFILSAFVIGAFVMAPTAAGYWGGNATPRWLEPLAFLGVASFMVGIALEFSTIPALLENRGQLMSACFPYLKKRS